MIIFRQLPLLLIVSLIAPGCATPQSVKDASAAQLQLIDSLDQATVALQNGLDDYAQEKQGLITAEGRILVARTAIYSALADDQSKTALVDFDTVFKTSNDKIRPYVDHSLEVAQDLDDAIKQLEQRIKGAPPGPMRDLLETDLQDLREQQALLANKPKEVLAIEAVIRGDLEDLGQTRSDLGDAITLLRAQFATLKGAAAVVNRWLGIDVTVTQSQVDSLSKTYSTLIDELKKPTTKPGSH